MNHANHPESAAKAPAPRRVRLYSLLSLVFGTAGVVSIALMDRFLPNGFDIMIWISVVGFVLGFAFGLTARGHARAKEPLVVLLGTIASGVMLMLYFPFLLFHFLP
jgi:hypothetical protein